jgi:pyruvyltransferase
VVVVRTFYWDPKAAPVASGGRLRRSRWKIGNAGDLLNHVIVREVYGAEVVNADDGAGHRLLLIGSVAHRVESGDLVFGVGTKGVPLPGPDTVSCRVVGTRGPITTDAFKQAGHDVSGLQFEFDPGLLIPSLMPSPEPATRGRVIFIPHYRDKVARRPRRGVARVVRIDADPVRLAQEIARAEFVFTSSLHGLIFAHALGRPARLVSPGSSEPLIKYQDYFASIGLRWRTLVDIDEAVRSPKDDSPVSLPHSLGDVRLPPLEELLEAGIAT